MRLTPQDRGRLKGIVDSFDSRKVLVIGDLVVYRYLRGMVREISPEAPVPLLEVTDEQMRPGFAANLAKYIADLGGRVQVAGVVGDDEEGGWLGKELDRICDGGSAILSTPLKDTLCVTRLIGRSRAGDHQLLRFDQQNADPIPPEMVSRIVRHVEENISGLDCLVISDHERGTVTPELIEKVVKIAREARKCVIADARAGHTLNYVGVNVFRTNDAQVSKVLGAPNVNETSLRIVGTKLLGLLESESVYMTMGGRGMVLFEPPDIVTHIPATEHVAIDVTGVGDAVTSALAVSLASGASKVDAGLMANIVAGIKVSRGETQDVTRSDVLRWLKGNQEDE